MTKKHPYTQKWLEACSQFAPSVEAANRAVARLNEILATGEQTEGQKLWAKHEVLDSLEALLKEIEEDEDEDCG